MLQKNAPELVAELASKFDGALLESAFAEGRRKDFLPYLEAGKPVFAVEYIDEISKEEFKTKICPLMQQY